MNTSTITSSETNPAKRRFRKLRFALIALAAFALTVVIFYGEENWRGKRAWENCKREYEAKGYVMDWDKLIPPPVPDDRNFFKAPKMAEWFVKIQSALTNELTKRLLNPDTTATNLNQAAVIKYLAWSDQFEPEFDLIREALQRPYARMDGDYSKPYESPIPNFVAVRVVAQTLAQRAKCDLLLGQPDKALQELTLLHDMRHLLECAPTGKPMTLVAAMINVAVTGLYLDTIAEGMRRHAWQEPQLTALQKQLSNINLTPFVVEALTTTEPVAVCRDVQIIPPNKIFDWNTTNHNTLWKLWPRGWTYQNMVNIVDQEKRTLNGFNPTNNTVAPRYLQQDNRDLDKFVGKARMSPYKLLTAVVIPNFMRAWQTTAHNQTMVNEAQIACALERYRLAHGEYPETLDVLAPQFIEIIPHDIIGGQPLHYRRTDDGKFLLYSVGWNETDDGGQETSAKTQYGSPDYTQGDWVWKN
jgi:hypothetical protein